MKFSTSLLSDVGIRKKLFTSGVEKSKELLALIFGLDFNSDNNILTINEQAELFTYTVSFLYHGRTLTASYGLETKEDNLETEVLSVAETDKEYVRLDKATESFSKNVNLIIEYLENRFELNFTPLDPAEDDKNILEINFDEKEQIWQVTFLNEKIEGKIIAAYMLAEKEEQTLQLTYLKKNIIIFD